MASNKSAERYFKNPYMDYDPRSLMWTIEKLQTSGFRSAWSSYIEDTILQCTHKTPPRLENCHGGLYTGSLGLIYTILHVLKNGHCRNNEVYLRDFVEETLKVNQAYFEKSEDITDRVEFLTGKGGLYIVSCMVASCMAGDADRPNAHQYAQLFADNWKICQHVNFLKNGSDEMFVGRAGYLSGLVFLKKYLNIEPLPQKDITKILDTMIDSGRAYSKKVSSPSPLMYAYHRTEYIGSAHGLAGILQTIMCFPDYLDLNQEAEKVVKESVDFLLSIQKPNGNFPTSMERLFTKDESSKDLIHWCHGAGGVVYMLAKSYLRWKDEKYLKASSKCGDLIWERGLLRKGPGLCHGLAGNGYVHLMLYRLTGEEKHFYRACKFAEFTKSTEFKSEANIPDHPFSLFEGLAGMVCFVNDLLEPQSAEFPFMPIF